MGILVRGNNLDGAEARRQFDNAIRYLKNSALAEDIITDLLTIQELLTIYVGTDSNPKRINVYAHPPRESRMSAGTIYWDPSVEVGVRDKVKNYKGGRLRPDVPWVQKHGTWTCCGKRFGTERDQEGVISAPMCLMHEMGHAVQFLSDKEGYRAIKEGSGVRPDLEQLNTEAIEQPIILELRAKGMAEGIRWDYLHTR